MDQKLTFYQTLTAPLGRGAADASPRGDEKPKTASAMEAGRSGAAPPPYPYASRGETVVEKSAHADPTPTTDKAAPYGETGTMGAIAADLVRFDDMAGARVLIYAEEFRDHLATLGAEPKPQTPEEFGRYINADVAKWSKLVKDNDVQLPGGK